MQTKFIYFVLIVYQCILIAFACQNHKTCHECITDPNVCIWCASGKYKHKKDPIFDSETRCRTQSQVDPKWCVGYLDIPDEAYATAITKFNRNFSSDEKDLVQVKPQLFNVKLRVGQPLNFTFSYQEAKDYPVDLYMLLDASYTMLTIKNEIAKHSETIYRTMQSMTKNVRMGFGTFVDKNTQPFTLDVTEKVAYSFKNHLNLTKDFTKFKSTVEHTAFGSNFDRPEGGFDALAQVIACDLNWRNKSRRIVVFLSDAIQHTVGDGRLGGIFKPFDGNCHTNEFGIYTKELEMDYPSIPKINALAADNDVIIIFATNVVKHTVQKYYEALKKAIRGSKFTMISENTLVNKLEESYKEISTRIKLDVSNSTNFEIKFDPDCYTNSDNEACKVIPEQQIDFVSTITLTKYTGKEIPSIGISVQGTKDKLSLDVEVIKCSCEGDTENSVPYCNHQKRECGICVCDKTKRGNRCMCDANDLMVSSADDSPCTTSEGVCNGRGKCQCGMCECAGTYFHRFCECNRKLCPGYNDTLGTVCSGHGTCDCLVEDGRGKETCSCADGWTHREKDFSCSCQFNNDLCMIGGTVCNNRGKCTCNACECESIAAWDKRPFQDELCRMQPCPDCHATQCTSLLKCVQCTLDSNCVTECNGIQVEIFETLPNELMNSTEWKVCENQKINIGCYINYVYQYDDVNHIILLRAREKTDCAESYYTYGGILLATLLLVGILTLLAWKCLTRYQDRKEFEKFEKQHKEDLYNVCENPIYNQPTTTFRNPAFQKN